MKPRKFTSHHNCIDECHSVRHLEPVTFEWDSNKAASNERKHGIRFEDAALALRDSAAMSWIDTRTDYGEVRVVTVGAIEDWLIVVVVHTDRSGTTRIISARPASQKERSRYESRKNQG